MMGTNHSRVMVSLAIVLVLVVSACSSDDETGGATTSTAETTTTTAPTDDTSGDGTSTTADEPTIGVVGTVTVDGEERTLDELVGVTSCQLDDPSGDLTVSARSDRPGEDTFLSLAVFGDSPDASEFTVSVGETEYVSESADAIDHQVDGSIVSGTVDVVPLFEEGNPQQVTFEVDCS